MGNKPLIQEDYPDTVSRTYRGLRELRVEVTRDCPLQCLHCSAYSSTDNTIHLSAECIIAVVKDYLAMGGDKVVITGGEPLVYPELMKVLNSLNAIGISPILYTSGITREGRSYRAVDEHEILQLKPLISGVAFSIYSASQKRHDYITQSRHSFAMSLNAMRIAVRHRIPTDVHFVPMKINYHDLLAVSDISHDLGVRKVRVLRFVPHGSGEKHAYRLLPSFEDYLAFAQVVEMTKARYSDFIYVGAAFRNLLPNVTKSCSVTNKVIVTADGSVAPCDGFKHLVNPSNEWNIYLKSLGEIYENSSLFRDIRNNMNWGKVEVSESDIPHSCSACLAQSAIALGHLI